MILSVNITHQLQEFSHFILIPFLEAFVSQKNAVSVLGYPTFLVYRYSAITPIYRSSVPAIGWITQGILFRSILVSQIEQLFLAKVGYSKSKILSFQRKTNFFEASMMVRSHLPRYFCNEKFSVKLCVGGCHRKIILSNGLLF